MTKKSLKIQNTVVHTNKFVEHPAGQKPHSVRCSSCSDGIIVRGRQYSQSTQKTQFTPETQAGKFMLPALQKWTGIEALEWFSEFLDRHKGDDIHLEERQIKNVKARILNVDRQKFFSWYEENNKNTAYVIKSDLRNYLLSQREKLILILKEVKAVTNNIRSLNDFDIVRTACIFKEADEHGVFDNHSRSETGKWRAYRNTHKSDVKSKKIDSSKRNTSNILPEDWQAILAEQMGFPIFLDLFILTGLRGEEVPSVNLAVTDHGHLNITIRTAKTKRGEPPRFRKLTLDKNHPSTQRLIKAIGHLDFSNFRKEAFRQQLGRVSEKLFGVRISPRNFRHDVAAMIKEIDGSTTIRGPAVLGHGASRTFSGYGRVGGKAGGTFCQKSDPIMSVESTEIIRETRSVRYHSSRFRTSPDNKKRSKPRMK